MNIVPLPESVSHFSLPHEGKSLMSQSRHWSILTLCTKLGVVILCIVAGNSHSLSAHDGVSLIPHLHISFVPGKWQNEVVIEIQGKQRLIRSNGIPDHQPGDFPRRGNPNRIQEQRYEFRMPVDPQIAKTTTPVGMNRFGVALNGVPFDPSAAEWYRRDPRSGWQYEAMSGKINLGLDEHSAHVQPDGGYHYHGMPNGMLQELNAGKDAMVLIGFAADGFPIYASRGHQQADDKSSPLVDLKPSYQLKTGERPSGPGGKYDGLFVEDYEYVAGSGDLDECNGRTGVTPEYPDGTAGQTPAQ